MNSGRRAGDKDAGKFVDKDFNSYLTTREYLQSRTLEENARIATRIREAIIVAVMFVFLICGLFGALLYSRHIETEVIANATETAAARDARNIAAETNLTQVCHYANTLLKTQQATLDLLIHDPIFLLHPDSAFAARLVAIKALQTKIDHDSKPVCPSYSDN